MTNGLPPLVTLLLLRGVRQLQSFAKTAAGRERLTDSVGRPRCFGQLWSLGTGSLVASYLADRTSKTNAARTN